MSAQVGNVVASLEGITRITRDLVEAARTLDGKEIRYAVDTYYQIQEFRKVTDNQIRSIAKEGGAEPHLFLDFVLAQLKLIEKNVKNGLAAFASVQSTAQWVEGVVGIGPVIHAGLEAHIDIEKAPTVGHIWRYAGLDPTTKWQKGEKRPWNASLKTLCWKIGDQFVKRHKNDACFYGKVYRQRKDQEIDRNERGDFADQASRIVTERPNHRQAAIYSAGKLPDGHIDNRARRYATKLFLAHYHHVRYETHFGEPPPLPYPITQLGHAHYVPPPNWPATPPERTM